MKNNKLDYLNMETTTQQPSDGPHIMLTSLGMRAIETEYEWNSKKAKAFLTPLALVELLEPEQLPNRVIAVISQGAKEATWETFQAGICKTLGLVPESVEIPDGNDIDEIRRILESVAKHIPEGADLTLDVTQGFRHFPFIFYALVLYLTSLRGVEIRGAYYGMYDAPGDVKPIINLRPLLELPEWFHAVRVFRDQGTTKPMADLLQPLAAILREETGQLFCASNKEMGVKRSQQARQVKDSVDGLERYAFAYESALPLELEKASRGLINSIRALPTIDSPSLPPLIRDLTKGITSTAEKSAFEKFPGKGNWKQSIDLDEGELERQAYMIDMYLDRGQLSLAVGLMREWVVSWAIWKSGNTADIGKWLNREVRLLYERHLGAIGAFAKNAAFKSTITTGQKEFGGFWNQLGDALRNVLHHHAMRIDAFEQLPTFLEDVRNFWNRLREGSTELPALGGGKGTMLLSPQGMRPGVLFSALKIAEPDTCLVICSETSASSIPDAASQAGFKGHIEQIELADPLGGFDEIHKVAERVHGYLLYADEVIANMTGGSTLMGVIVQRLVEDAQKLDRPVKRFALIDRRPTEEQDSDPFVRGDSYWLD